MPPFGITPQRLGYHLSIECNMRPGEGLSPSSELDSDYSLSADLFISSIPPHAPADTLLRGRGQTQDISQVHSVQISTAIGL